MAEAFVGTWNLVSSENFDEYMKELGESLAPFSLPISVDLDVFLAHARLTDAIWMMSM